MVSKDIYGCSPVVMASYFKIKYDHAQNELLGFDY